MSLLQAWSRPRPVGRFALAILLAFLPGLSQGQDLTAAEIAERCANNKARLEELKRQVAAVPVWTPIQRVQAGKDHAEVGTMAGQELGVKHYSEFGRIAVRYGYNLAPCATISTEECGLGLLEAIGQAMKSDEQNVAERERLEAEAHRHEVNLIALSCVAPTLDIAGTWQSDWGVMQLDGVGTVEGTYAYQGGRVAGRMEGHTLVGRWSQTSSGQKCKHPELGSYYWGRLRLTFADSGKSFAGDWSYCEAEPTGGGWNGSR